MEILIQIDENILLFIQEHLRQDWMNDFWSAVTHPGTAAGYGFAQVFYFCCSKGQGRPEQLSYLHWVIGALITNVVLKNAIARIRPYEVVEGLHILIGEGKWDFFLSVGTCLRLFCGGNGTI